MPNTPFALLPTGSRSVIQSDLCKIRDGIATEDHMGVYHALGVCVENRIESHEDDDPDSHVTGFTTVSELNELKAALAWCSNKVMQEIEPYGGTLAPSPKSATLTVTIIPVSLHN